MMMCLPLFRQGQTTLKTAFWQHAPNQINVMESSRGTKKTFSLLVSRCIHLRNSWICSQRNEHPLAAAKKLLPQMERTHRLDFEIFISNPIAFSDESNIITATGLVERPWSTEQRGISPLFLFLTGGDIRERYNILQRFYRLR